MREAPRERPKLLVLTPRFPYPVIGGDRLRIHAICKALARDHSLTLLSLCDRAAEMDATLVIDDVFDRIERVYLPKWRSRLNALRALPGHTPLQVAYYRSAAFATRVDELLPEHDLCLAHLIRTGDYVRASATPTLLEMTDAISLNYERVRGTGLRTPRGLIYGLEQRRLRQYERRMPAQFDAVSLIASADAHYLFGADLPANVVLASNGVDCRQLGFRDRAEAPRIAVFIGNLHSAQNLDACRYFIEQILPLIRPDVLTEFRIIGRVHPTDARSLAAHPRVTVTGEVASIVDAVTDGWIGVCPVRLGAGVQNKVLEYMALGLPTVATPVGHEGIAAERHEDLLVAGTPAAFVEAIERIAASPELHRKLAVNGRRFVETYHGWEAALKPIVDRAKAILAARA